MVVIPAGSFLMGSSLAELARYVEGTVPRNAFKFAQAAMTFEQPQHPISIRRPFALAKNRVTKSEFAAFVGETGYLTEGGCTLWADHSYLVLSEADWKSPGFAQTDRDPVVCVSWEDAKAYIAWLNKKLRISVPVDGDGPYRLPSEAEWEYAARAGTRTARWWGDSIGSGNADCDGCGSRWDKKQTAPTGSFLANAFGLSDVLGNTWEWNEDCWNENYVEAPLDGRTWLTGKCELRVMRGGGWTNHPWVLRSALRSKEHIDKRTNYIGFRVAKKIP